MQFPLDTVREVAQILGSQGLGEITLESGGARLTLKRPPFVAVPASGAPPETEATPALETRDDLSPASDAARVISVVSPAVGVFRAAKKPLQPGDVVARKAVLGAVETLNIPTDLIAPENARVLEILIIEGQRVEWGQPLLILEPIEQWTELSP